MIAWVKKCVVSVWPFLLILAAWWYLFSDLISGEMVCGFRDSGYLYYPLFKWLDAQWLAGEIPLWNHYDQFGVPVVADGSTSVFYPGKAIFLLRELAFESRYGIYLGLHVLLAAVNAYWLARRFGCQRSGAALAALSYAFGGSVLFQVTNVIYLVGAAWLPLALGCFYFAMEAANSRSGMKWAVGGRSRMRGNRIRRRSTTGVQSWLDWGGCCCFRLVSRVAFIGDLKRNLLRLVVIVLVAFATSAIQVLPMADWVASSERASTRLTWQEKIQVPELATHHDFAYQFSQPPWSMTELLIPNFSGRPFSVNERWADALPGADRMWVPSLYAGCLTLLLAILSFRLWGGTRKQVWLSRVGLFFALGSLGWYGAGWLFTELTGGQDPPFETGPQVGGVYWFLFSFVPKYSMFRYPAKLFVIASLVISLLAGLSMNKLLESHKKSFLAVTTILVAVLGSAFLWESALDQFLMQYWEQVPADPLFGPFEITGATRRLVRSCTQVAIVFGIAAGVVVLMKRERLVGVVFAVLLCVDLLLANHWMLAKTDVWMFNTGEVGPNQTTVMASELRYPESFSKLSDPYKLDEIVTFQNRSLAPKNHLLIPSRNLYSFNSIDRPLPQISEWHLRVPFAFFVEGEDVSEVFNFKEEQVKQVELQTHKNGYYEIRVETARRGVLYIQNSFTKDWKASIENLAEDSADGKAAILESALGGLQAVSVPAGTHVVKLDYVPLAFYLGAWISGFSWGMLVLYFGYQIFTRRKLSNGFESS